MFALICLLLGFILAAAAYGAWENMAKGYWVWLVLAIACFVSYGMQINS